MSFILLLKNDPQEVGALLAQEQQQREAQMAEPLKDPAQQDYLNGLKEESAMLEQQIQQLQIKSQQNREKRAQAEAERGQQ